MKRRQFLNAVLGAAAGALPSARALGNAPPGPAAPLSEALREGILDEGRQDTFLLLPGDTVRVQKRFEHHLGLFLYHCHNLEHEDMGMMRNFLVEG